MEFGELLIAALLAGILIVLVKLLRTSKNNTAAPAVPAQKPQEPFDLEFHFQNREETDLDQINAELAKHALSNLEIVDRHGYLATQTVTNGSSPDKQIRYWYGLDDLVLHCTPATDKACYHYQIGTMVFNKDEADCCEQYRKTIPDRVMRLSIELECEDVRALVVLHHEKK